MTTTAYDQLICEFHALLTDDPNRCVSLGVESHLDELPDPTLSAADAFANKATALAATIASFPRDGLDVDRALDLDLAALTLRRHALEKTNELDGARELARLPTAGDDIGDGIYGMMINDPRPPPERLRDITRRIEKVPAYLDALRSRLDRPVARWAEIDRRKVEELPELFRNLERWADDEAFSGRRELTSAMSSAHDAMRRYTEALSAMPTSTRLAIGPARTREHLDARGIELDVDELRAIAASFVARNREEVESLRRSLVAKYGLASDTSAAKLRDELDRRYMVPADRVLETYAEESARIIAFIRERDLFPIPPDQTIDIIATPKFLREVIPAGAMIPPPPFREGVRKSVVFLTLGSASIRHSLLSIPMMLIHECIPGHHLQLSTASIKGSVVRRHVDALEHGEGWTTMLEDYMLDVGYGAEVTDEMRFVAKRELARIGPRVAIDLYFMTGDPRSLDIGIDVERASEDPFTNAAGLLAATTDFSPERIQGELNWYSQRRGVPLSYLVGNDLVWRLRRDVRARRDDPDEADRAFHRAYLESGNMPVSRLRSLLAHQGAI